MRKLTGLLFLFSTINLCANIKKDSLFFMLDSTHNSICENDSIIENDTIKKETLWSSLKYDARNAANGFLYTFAQPTRWKKKDFLYLGGTILGTGILYYNDEKISSFFSKQESNIPHTISEFGFRFGKPQINYGITSSVYLIGLLSKNEKIRYTGVLMITSASVSGLLQQTLKTVTGRARPGTELGHDFFEPFNGSPSFSSFPSGHTALSVTTCYALSKQFNNPWIKAGFYTLGMISPISRIWERAHWASDVFLSTVMSIAIVESVDSYLKRDKKYNFTSIDNKKKISWNMRIGYNQIGLIGAF
jgi:membrane-associated phospholipid phosphatase